MKIAVAGGTGAVGRHVVDVARETGHESVVLTRSTGVDLVAGEGLADALPGVDAVIDVASVQTMSDAASRAFFGAVTRNLLAAETAAGVGHHVALSIVGVDDAPYAYYAGKVLQEQLVEAGPVPWTILRATQFHEFAAQLHARMRFGPIVVVPALQSQPVAARGGGRAARRARGGGARRPGGRPGRSPGRADVGPGARLGGGDRSAGARRRDSASGRVRAGDARRHAARAARVGPGAFRRSRSGWPRRRRSGIRSARDGGRAAPCDDTPFPMLTSTSTVLLGAC